MELLYICMYQFVVDKTGVYSMPSFGDSFWNKYLKVYDSIHIVGEPLKGYLDKSKLVKLDMDRVCVDLLPANNSPQDWKNDRYIKKSLSQMIENAESIIIKPASRKGIIAIKLAKRYKKPYLIEITGDLYTALKNHSNVLKRLYAPLIYCQIKDAIKDCKFGIYVTENYLQKQYPIEGKTCGASDAVIRSLDEDVLIRRIQRINQTTEIVKIGLVGFYHDRNKGIDTAIEAVGRLRINGKKIELHILGNGSEADRQKWLRFAQKRSVSKETIVFPSPIIGKENMFIWYDSMDIIILPSRSEGLPRTIVEAMSRACPCITSNVCGLSELINPKWAHNPGDSTRLSELLKRMICDNAEQIETANENFNRAHNYLEATQTGKRIAFLNDYKKYCEER